MMSKHFRFWFAVATTAGLAAIAGARAADSIPLTSLDLSHARQGWGAPQTNVNMRGGPLKLGGKVFTNGFGTHAVSTLWVRLAGGSERFTATVGVDDQANGAGSVVFRVLGDGRPLWDSGIVKTGEVPRTVEVDLRGIQLLLLQVTDAGDGVNFDHADWADARFLVSGVRPEAVAAPDEAPVLLTPKPGPAPRLTGPKVLGVRPGNPFLHRIPCQGERPMRFVAEGLPSGIRLDASTGILSGTNPPRGEYRVALRAENSHGRSERPLRIASGDTVALTPPMGWNHWYAHYNRITDKMMREAAEVMVSSGMADVGYEYVNIDDCWMNAEATGKYQPDPQRVGPLRDAQGNIVANRLFPDMRALTEYIHAKGLKAGIYTSPGPKTCAGFAGAWQHEAQDARQFAAWGFDFLKYDWCSYGGIAKDDKSLAALQKPYRLMGNLLKQQPRDLVFNLCQYGMGNVWEWGADVGGHCWRTAGDLGFELNRIFEVALKNAEHREASRPGAWNDPDYLQIGHIGNAHRMGEPAPCSLTPSEQYAFMSLWCLMASPLFYSGDMMRLDPFTLNVLCNPEVIEVDQDELGQSARVVRLDAATFLMVKDLADGSKALGLCNQGEFPTPVNATWSALGVKGAQRVRDLWRQQDVGEFTNAFSTQVPRHGVALLKLSPVP